MHAHNHHEEAAQLRAVRSLGFGCDGGSPAGEINYGIVFARPEIIRTPHGHRSVADETPMATTPQVRQNARWRRWTGIRLGMAAIILATGGWLALVAASSAGIAASPILGVPASAADLTFAGHLYVMGSIGVSLACGVVAGFRNDRRWLYPALPAIVAGVAAATVTINRSPGPDTVSLDRNLEALWFDSSLALMLWVLVAAAAFAAFDRRRRERIGEPLGGPRPAKGEAAPTTTRRRRP